MHMMLKIISRDNLSKGTPESSPSERLVDLAGCSLGREKLCVQKSCPYRKPTQVDEERILRPTREGLSRNSAN